MAPNATETPAQGQQDLLGRKFDRCLADHIVKAGLGFGAGVVLSVILFRRRTWPIALSTGFGLGMAYADCDRSFNPARIPGTRILPSAPASSPPPAAAPPAPPATPTPPEKSAPPSKKLL